MNAEALYARLYRAGVGALPSGLEARAASAIERAAWDIRGEALGQPGWRLLGAWAQPLFISPARIEDGELCLPETPGLGLELDEDALQRCVIT